MLAFPFVALQVLGCYFLSSLGLITPFISCGVTILICAIFNCGPALTFLFVIFSYFTCFLSNNVTDFNQSLITSNSSDSFHTSQKENPSFYPLLLLKAGLFFLFLILPIPKPPSYFTGIFAFLVLYCFVFFNSCPEDNFFLGLLGFFLVYLLLAFASSFGKFNLVISLVSGIVICNLFLQLIGQNVDPSGYSDYPPNPFFACLSLFISWISPGFSLNTSVSSLINPGPWQSFLSSIFSLILEAWNLGLLCRGELSTKTPLASLLTTPTRITQAPIIDTLSMSPSIIPAVLVFVSLSFAIVLILPSLTPQPLFLIFSFTCQSFLFLGPSLLFLLPLSFLCCLILRFSLPHSPHAHPLSILLAMSF